MFQVLRLTEFALVHKVPMSTIGEIIAYIAISMLPILFPMALLFSVLLTYGRLSQDSEIVAMKAAGLHMGTILTPALVLGTLIGIISAQMSFNIAPWGNRQFEVLYSRIANTKAAAVIKEGTFSEGFFDMVVYANKVNSDKGLLEHVFIYDEKNSDSPLTIIAKGGQIISDKSAPGINMLLRLTDGEIHRQAENHTKISFKTYDVKFAEDAIHIEKAKSAPSLTLEEIRRRLQEPISDKEELLTLKTEFHKRIAISVLCLVFAAIGVALGTVTNKRSAKAGGMILCIGVIITYWILYIASEGAARGGKAPVAILIWAPNVLFGFFALYKLKKNWN